MEEAQTIKESFHSNNPVWYGSIAPKLKFFYTEDDRAGISKVIQGIILGAQIVSVPRTPGEVSSTQIGEWFGVQKNVD